jgi:hypothetical protein
MVAAVGVVAVLVVFFVLLLPSSIVRSQSCSSVNVSAAVVVDVAAMVGPAAQRASIIRED